MDERRPLQPMPMSDPWAGHPLFPDWYLGAVQREARFAARGRSGLKHRDLIEIQPKVGK